jgi:hypothetical protein
MSETSRAQRLWLRLPVEILETTGWHVAAAEG